MTCRGTPGPEHPPWPAIDCTLYVRRRHPQRCQRPAALIARSRALVREHTHHLRSRSGVDVLGLVSILRYSDVTFGETNCFESRTQGECLNRNDGNRQQDLLEEELLIEQEADEVEHDLALPSLLGILGTPVRVGSSALGVMVNRDLDVTVICSDLQVPKVVELGALLALHQPRASGDISKRHWWLECRPDVPRRSLSRNQVRRRG